jgi:hypothetical protein
VDFSVFHTNKQGVSDAHIQLLEETNMTSTIPNEWNIIRHASHRILVSDAI